MKKHEVWNIISIFWVIYSFIAAILGFIHIKNKHTRNLIWILYGVIAVLMGLGTLIYAIVSAIK